MFIVVLVVVAAVAGVAVGAHNAARIAALEAKVKEFEAAVKAKV